MVSSTTDVVASKKILDVSDFAIGETPNAYYVANVSPDKELMLAVEDHYPTAAIYLLDRKGNKYSVKKTYNLGTRPIAWFTLDRYVIAGYGSYLYGSSSEEHPALFIAGIDEKSLKIVFYKNGGVTTHNFESFIVDLENDLLIVGTGNGGQHVIGFKLSCVLNTGDGGDISSCFVFDIDATSLVGSPPAHTCNIFKLGGKYYIYGGNGDWENVSSPKVGIWELTKAPQELSGDVKAENVTKQVWVGSGLKTGGQFVVWGGKAYLNTKDSSGYKVKVFDGSGVSDFVDGYLGFRFLNYIAVVDSNGNLVVYDLSGNKVYTYQKQGTGIPGQMGALGIFTDWDKNNNVAHVMTLTYKLSELRFGGITYKNGKVYAEVKDIEGNKLAGIPVIMVDDTVFMGAGNVDNYIVKKTDSDGWVEYEPTSKYVMVGL